MVICFGDDMNCLKRPVNFVCVLDSPGHLMEQSLAVIHN
jgi:hypothetical protein